MAKAPGIRLENLSVGYGGIPVASGLDLTMPGGKVTVVVGGSGCGKSTLIKHILRLHEPIEGAIYIGGHNVHSLSGKAARCMKQQMGVLFQDGALLGSLTIFDNLALPLREHTRLKENNIREIIDHKLKLVGLSGSEEKYPTELSGGMRKRAGLARALVMDPQVLFCDEPTSGLDPILSAELDHLLLDMMAHFDMTMVVVSHDLASMRAIADHVVVLGDGRSLFQGTVEELDASEDEYLRRFLDRLPEERDTPRLTMPPIGVDMFKDDCSKLLDLQHDD
ncbi:ABC transporter ATP-binding protein [Salidesulfovibrio brasiliensis]|uniref:ABC transporter ATP-binding protein n=1 Tax=Salidesulfovibrio brasiliensis TaxID=221711 RepID=UPI0006D1EE5A|nr:ATP-binding cassette domain-containing protein [Salidesulfovibrio brasiliensis]